MFSKKSIRLLVPAFCVATLVALGVSQFENRVTPPHRSVEQTNEQTNPLRASAETPKSQTLDSKPGKSPPSVKISNGNSAIPAFRQWAETAAAAGFADADETKGMELAKARAGSMKALIQTDPAAALRQALPADLRASLPKTIAATIEQPVKATGMCSMRMMCNHSPDSPHGGCESAPVLLEDVNSWNAYYGEHQWKSLLGKTVGFDGIAVDEELAVKSITPVSSQ